MLSKVIMSGLYNYYTIMNQDQMEAWNMLPNCNRIGQIFDLDEQNIDRYLDLQQPSNQQIHNLSVAEQKKEKTRKPNLYHEYIKMGNYLETQSANLSQKELYLQETRKDKLLRYLKKKKLRIWQKKVVYVSRQKVANDRQRIRGKFTSNKKQITNILQKEDMSTMPLSPPNIGPKFDMNQCTQS